MLIRTVRVPRHAGAVNRNHLATFHAVAEAGSISRAAVALHLTQPAVSKQIADLETRVGQRLFDRVPRRGACLTAAGTVLADYAKRIALLESQAGNALRSLRDLGSGSLAIGASSTIGTYLLPRTLAVFRERWPDLGVRLEVGNSAHITRMLRAGTVDLGFTEGPHLDEDILAEGFLQDELVVIARPGHPLAATCVTPAQLCQQPFLMREAGSGTRAVFEQALAALGLAVPSAMTLASNEAIKQAVAASRHLAALPRLAVALELRLGHLVVIPVAGLPLRRELEVLRLRWKPRDHAAVAFLHALSEDLAMAAVDDPALRPRVAALAR